MSSYHQPAQPKNFLLPRSSLNDLDIPSVLLPRRAAKRLPIVLQLLDQLSNTEQVIHLLERNTLGLRNEEPNEEEHGEAERAVDQESAIAALAHSSQHIGRSTGHDKVEKPLRGRRKGDVHGPQPRGRDLGDVDPAAWSPSELEEGGEQEDAHERKVAGGRHGLADHGRGDAHVDAHVEHGCALGDRGPEQGAAAAEGVGGEEEEGGAGDHFDDAVDAGGEEAGFGGVEAKVLEDLGSVVWLGVSLVLKRGESKKGRLTVDGIGTGHLLADHQADRDESTLAVARNEPHFPLEVHEGSTADQSPLVLELFPNLTEFMADVVVVSWQLAQVCEDSFGVFPSVGLCEPTRRFLAQEHADEEGDGRESLGDERED